jgi:thioredoxin-related protein
MNNYNRLLTYEATVKNPQWLSTAMILTLGLGLIAWQLNDEPAKSSGIEWLTFESAHAKTIKEKKLMMVDVYTDWCSWCKVMDKETFGHPDVVKFAQKNMVMAKMNAESEAKVRFRGREYTQRQLAMGLGVTGYPTVVFFDGKGDLVTTVSGYIPPDKFLPILEYLHGRHYEKKITFEDFLAQRKK